MVDYSYMPIEPTFMEKILGAILILIMCDLSAIMLAACNYLSKGTHDSYVFFIVTLILMLVLEFAYFIVYLSKNR